MIRSITQLDYSFEVDLKLVLDADHKAEENDDPELWEKLQDINGINDVDYNGHFGNIICLKVNPEFDNEEMWKKIENVTMKHIGINYQYCPECNCLLDRHWYEPEYTAKCLACNNTIEIKKGFKHHAISE